MRSFILRFLLSKHRSPILFSGAMLVVWWTIFNLSVSANPPRTSIPLSWTPVDSLNAGLPEGIRLYAGRNDAIPLRAWYVSIDEPHPRIITRVVVSDDPEDGKETVSSFAKDLGALVAVNGGYFRMDLKVAQHVGLCISDHSLIAPATHTVIRDSTRYWTARAAIGFTDDDRADIAWVTSRNDSLFAISIPPMNRPGKPAQTPPAEQMRFWNVRDALGAGPSLLSQGRIHIASDEEVFFGSSIPKTHPRSSVGVRQDGSLVILVVDGRQAISRGVNLEELAGLLLDLGVEEAMNLDGGGSSTLVVNQTLVNRPTGGLFQREVMSALVTHMLPE